jgi:hypothetical protein
MDPLTAVALLVGRYSVQELVSAFTGRAELGGLASELSGAMVVSESRISDRLAQVEQRLSTVEQRINEVLAQRYRTTLNGGMRSLLDAGRGSRPEPAWVGPARRRTA